MSDYDRLRTQGPPPWHMWGTSEVVELPPGVSFASRQSQLARINYKRPETWSFFFAAHILANDVGAGLNQQIIDVTFDIFTGVGRSLFNTAQRASAAPTTPGNHGFCRFTWVLPPGQNGTTREKKWTTRVPTPLLDDNAATSSQLCEWIASEQIQCSASVLHVRVDPTQSATVELHSYFAPRSHIRPDWYLDAESAAFRGGEIGGT